MIGPSTSACPVAVTVLGKPKPRKSPCARTDQDENNIKTETKTANRNFILLASYSQMHRRWPSGKTMDLGQVRGAGPLESISHMEIRGSDLNLLAANREFSADRPV